MTEKFSEKKSGSVSSEKEYKADVRMTVTNPEHKMILKHEWDQPPGKNTTIRFNCGQHVETFLKYESQKIQVGRIGQLIANIRFITVLYFIVAIGFSIGMGCASYGWNSWCRAVTKVLACGVVLAAGILHIHWIVRIFRNIDSLVSKACNADSPNCLAEQYKFTRRIYRVLYILGFVVSASILLLIDPWS